MRRVGHAPQRLDDRETVAEKILQCLVIARRAKPAENQRAAGRDLHRRQRRAHVFRGLVEELRALRDADRMPLLVVAPLMKAADNRPVALVGVAQWKRAMRAAVFKGAQIVPEALHEDRARRQAGAEPVTVIRDIAGVSQERPDPRQLRLLTVKRRLVDERIGPVQQLPRAGVQGDHAVDQRIRITALPVKSRSTRRCAIAPTLLRHVDRDLGLEPDDGAPSGARPMPPRATLMRSCNSMRPAPRFVKVEGHAPSPPCSRGGGCCEIAQCAASDLPKRRHPARPARCGNSC
jgi:hypothetical protein